MSFDEFADFVESKIAPFTLNESGRSGIALLFNRYPLELLEECINKCMNKPIRKWYEQVLLSFCAEEYEGYDETNTVTTATSASKATISNGDALILE